MCMKCGAHFAAHGRGTCEVLSLRKREPSQEMDLHVFDGMWQDTWHTHDAVTDEAREEVRYNNRYICFPPCVQQLNKMADRAIKVSISFGRQLCSPLQLRASPLSEYTVARDGSEATWCSMDCEVSSSGFSVSLHVLAYSKMVWRNRELRKRRKRAKAKAVRANIDTQSL